MAEEVDLFVIGAGSGGVRAARIASGYGARVMIAEEYRVGGTCVIRGCVPKKLLVYASRFADEFEDAAGYGWTVPEPSFDWADADRQQGPRDRAARSGLHRQPRPRQGADRQEPRGHARSAHGQARRHRRDRARQAHPDRDRRARRIWAPTSRASSTSSPRTRPSICAQLPKRILIQGGGYIALEFATIFNGLGSEVTVVYRGENILRGFDDDVRTHLRAELEKRGIKILCKRIVEGVEKVEHGLDVELSDHEQIVVDAVMFATGRRPNIAGLGLEAAGVQIGQTGGDRGRRILADLGAEHLRHRRRHQPHQPDAGGDPRRPCLRRHACSAAGRRRSTTPTCRPRCSPSPRSASSA